MINETMTIAEILAVNEELAEVLMAHGMHCVGCPAHSHETLKEACEGHGLDTQELMTQMNDYLKNNQ